MPHLKHVQNTSFKQNKPYFKIMKKNKQYRFNHFYAFCYVKWITCLKNLFVFGQKFIEIVSYGVLQTDYLYIGLKKVGWCLKRTDKFHFKEDNKCRLKTGKDFSRRWA